MVAKDFPPHKECPQSARLPTAHAHLVVYVELVHVAAVHHEADHEGLRVDVHALELPRLVVAALVVVEGHVAQALPLALGGVHLGVWQPDVHLHLAGDLRAQTNPLNKFIIYIQGLEICWKSAARRGGGQAGWLVPTVQCRGSVRAAG